VTGTIDGNAGNVIEERMAALSDEWINFLLEILDPLSVFITG